jgi:3-oxoacyl-[acyl-carrier protein] reductase
MELGLKNKVALVTGASRGIGAASAKALAHHGAAVVINYIKSKDKAEALLEEIKQAGGNGMTFQADVRDQTASDYLSGEYIPVTGGSFMV